LRQINNAENQFTYERLLSIVAGSSRWFEPSIAQFPDPAPRSPAEI